MRGRPAIRARNSQSRPGLPRPACGSRGSSGPRSRPPRRRNRPRGAPTRHSETSSRHPSASRPATPTARRGSTRKGHGTTSTPPTPGTVCHEGVHGRSLRQVPRVGRRRRTRNRAARLNTAPGQHGAVTLAPRRHGRRQPASHATRSGRGPASGSQSTCCLELARRSASELADVWCLPPPPVPWFRAVEARSRRLGQASRPARDGWP